MSYVQPVQTGVDAYMYISIGKAKHPEVDALRFREISSSPSHSFFYLSTFFVRSRKGSPTASEPVGRKCDQPASQVNQIYIAGRVLRQGARYRSSLNQD